MAHFEKLCEQYPIKTSLQLPDIHLDPPQGFVERPNRAVTDHLLTLPAEQLTAEDHFSINIDLAWLKLNEYYGKLDNTPIYVAAVVLHPCYKWKWLEKKWQQRPDWLAAARLAFTALTNQYRDLKPTNHDQTPSKKQRAKGPDDSSDDEPDEPSIDDQVADYKRDPYFKHQVKDKEDSPIKYWLDKRTYWPQLAALALDIYAIPVMSDEPE